MDSRTNAELREQRINHLEADIKRRHAAISDRRANMSADEAETLGEKMREIVELQRQVASLKNEERGEIAPTVRSAVEGSRDERRSAPSAHSVTSKARPIYGVDGEHSYFMDLANASRGSLTAATRIDDSNRAILDAADRQTRDLYDNATDGAEALVPVYLQDRFEKYRSDIAVAANLTNRQALPKLGESLTIPVQTGAASVATQTQATPLSAMSETDAQFTTKSANIVEIGGVQDISLYLVDRGTLGVGVDVAIGNHLAELLAQDEDERVLAAVDAGAGIAVTYTATTGTLADIYRKLADCAQQVVTGNKLPPTGIVVHERRFFSWAAELDQDNRPLMVPIGAAHNPLSMSSTNSPTGPGFTGFTIHGVPVYIDSNVTVLNGAGTNEDVVYMCDWSQQYTWSSPVMVEMDRSTMFKNSGLTVRARRYMATMVTHREDAFGRITGTGLATPSFS